LNFPALSVRQPWAELIMSGSKPIELRTWDTDYRGRIWIHAGLHVDEALDARFGLRDSYRGGFIGSVELTSIEPLDARRWKIWQDRHHTAGPFQPGLFAWVLVNPRRLRSPVRSSGRLGLYRVEPEVLSQLSAADSQDDGGQ
jgi:ASCH domain-containing protein